MTGRFSSELSTELDGKDCLLMPVNEEWREKWNVFKTCVWLSYWKWFSSKRHFKRCINPKNSKSLSRIFFSATTGKKQTAGSTFDRKKKKCSSLHMQISKVSFQVTQTWKLGGWASVSQSHTASWMRGWIKGCMCLSPTESFWMEVKWHDSKERAGGERRTELQAEQGGS